MSGEVKMLDFIDLAEERLRKVLADQPLEVEIVEVLAEIARRGLREPKRETKR
jgi:hypothetical protein